MMDEAFLSNFTGKEQELIGTGAKEKGGKTPPCDCSSQSDMWAHVRGSFMVSSMEVLLLLWGKLAKEQTFVLQ